MDGNVAPSHPVLKKIWKSKLHDRLKNAPLAYYSGCPSHKG